MRRSCGATNRWFERCLPIAQTRTRACMTLMSQRKFRHLPVVDGDKVVGMISIQDLMDDIISDQEATIEQLTTYIQS